MAPLPAPSPARALPTRVSAPPSSGLAAVPLAGARTHLTSNGLAVFPRAGENSNAVQRRGKPSYEALPLSPSSL